MFEVWHKFWCKNLFIYMSADLWSTIPNTTHRWKDEKIYSKRLIARRIHPSTNTFVNSNKQKQKQEQKKRVCFPSCSFWKEPITKQQIRKIDESQSGEPIRCLLLYHVTNHGCSRHAVMETASFWLVCSTSSAKPWKICQQIFAKNFLPGFPLGTLPPELLNRTLEKSWWRWLKTTCFILVKVY